MYGQTVHAINARQALVETAKAVKDWGQVVKPRGKETRELRHFTLSVADPTDWHCSGINASWSPMLAAVEAIQLISGQSRPSWAVQRVPGFARFMNDRGGFDGAYGPRVGVTLAAAVKRLKEDPDTRQAVVPIYGPSDTLREGSKDYPCTLTLHFFVRMGHLELDVNMRSNDVDWGLKHDMSQFMLLQCTVANLLNLRPGNYHHTANSMHLYETSYEWAAGLSDRGLFEPSATIPFGGMSTGFPMPVINDLWAHAESIINDTKWDGSENDVDRWLRETLRVSDSQA